MPDTLRVTCFSEKGNRVNAVPGKLEIEHECSHDITYYVKDSRLTEPSDDKRYRWRDMIEKSKEVRRPLTDKEAEEFRVE